MTDVSRGWDVLAWTLAVVGTIMWVTSMIMQYA